MVIRQTPTLVAPTEQILFHNGARFRCGTICLLIKGIFFTIIAIIFCIWTPFSVIMDERMRMHKGLPPFDIWAQPPDQVVMNVRIFNYTNAEQFLSGEEDFVKVEEIGPIVYRELLTHHNITRNANDTISYVAKHTAKYWPEANTINLNATIMVPNYAALGIVTFLHEAPFFVKFGLNLLMRQQRTKLFKEMTIWNFLWNYTDPILYKAHSIMPHLAPIDNIGMLHRIYEDFQDSVTMYIGAEHGPERFSLIDKFNGSSSLPNYAKCQDKVTNATEGVTYGQFMTRKTVLKYWRKTICKVAKLMYESDIVYQGIDTFKFVLPPTSFDRTYPEENDCYKGYPSLPNGLTDVSNCMYNVPIAASFPHFMFASPSILEGKIKGMQPNAASHMSYVITEPITGVPLEQVARSQSNMIVRKIGGFSDDVLRFSDRILPMFWLEYNQVSLPWDIYLLVYGVSNILKPAQIVFIITLFLLGFWYTVRFGKMFTASKEYKRFTEKYAILHKKKVRPLPQLYGMSQFGIISDGKSKHVHSSADEVQRTLLSENILS